MTKHDVFQLEIGNTERSIEEIIGSIRKSDLPIVHIKQVPASSNKTSSGATIAIETATEAISAAELKQQLNEYGGCMYQVVSIIKS
ncbi:hypothetical protein [Pelosinus sp. UFO1]|uniref:hypothetical protein n=1 Tax=Pelosinus sp. UFO1 TaxID=484770 RepID=UPI0004D0F04E|nr:hypothetical protein [Pelosinus sp. UFO1]AIF52770.1 hypothetical protein UFO1_3227 [Pelosinus sp. UFO1]